MMTLTPTLLWAQTKDDLYLTVELSKPSDLKVDMTDEDFKFFAKKDGNVYQFDFKFFKPVKSSEHKRKDERFLEFKVPKSEPASWSTLNSCGKKHYIKCNWDKWVDSDAEDELNDGFDMPNFGDFGNFDMNGMGDMGDLGDMEDDLDDLDETEDGVAADEPKRVRSPYCKNPNCQCDPCECTEDRQCSESSCAKGSCSESCESEAKPAADSCSNKCSEKCPC